MSAEPTTGITPVPVIPFAPVYQQVIQQICNWGFEDSYISRLLKNDIPQRLQKGRGNLWIYRDTAKQIVGFGTMDVCLDYGYVTGNKYHPHIPLLAVRPDM